jgi:hypothetical protein
MQHKSAAQDIATQIVASEEYRFAIGLLLGRFPSAEAPVSDRPNDITP